MVSWRTWYYSYIFLHIEGQHRRLISFTNIHKKFLVAHQWSTFFPSAHNFSEVSAFPSEWDLSLLGKTTGDTRVLMAIPKLAEQATFLHLGECCGLYWSWFDLRVHQPLPAAWERRKAVVWEDNALWAWVSSRESGHWNPGGLHQDQALV